MTSGEQFSVQVGAEVAKSIGEAAKEALMNLLGPPTAEMGQFVGDRIAYWRADNLVKVYEKFRYAYRHRQYPAEALARLPIGFRALIAEESSKEDDDDLQQLWANLLSAAVEDGYTDQLKSIAQDLQSMTPRSVKMLLAIEAQEGERKVPEKVDAFDRKYAFEVCAYSDAELERGLAVLSRLGMIAPVGDQISANEIVRSNLAISDKDVDLAKSIIGALLDYMEIPPLLSELNFRRLKTKNSGSFVWFQMDLSRYGKEFLKVCIKR